LREYNVNPIWKTWARLPQVTRIAEESMQIPHQPRVRGFSRARRRRVPASTSIPRASQNSHTLSSRSRVRDNQHAGRVCSPINHPCRRFNPWFSTS